MVSVCMAAYNGAKYIGKQVESILIQLNEDDELIVSDDGSTDGTITIIESFQDKRIKLIHNGGRRGVVGNFENAVGYALGDIIFFSDQDDLWFPEKISEIVSFIAENNYDIVSCSCSVTDSDLNVTKEDYFGKVTPVSRSAIGNILRNQWLGCCMAFRRRILNEVLPFPDVVAHDIWVGVYGQMRFKCGYYPKPLQYYRRHNDSVSTAGGNSSNPYLFRVEYRIKLVKELLRRALQRRSKR